VSDVLRYVLWGYPAIFWDHQVAAAPIGFQYRIVFVNRLFDVIYVLVS